MICHDCRNSRSRQIRGAISILFQAFPVTNSQPVTLLAPSLLCPVQARGSVWSFSKQWLFENRSLARLLVEFQTSLRTESPEYWLSHPIHLRFPVRCAFSCPTMICG